jgi:hypothetical protein
VAQAGMATFELSPPRQHQAAQGFLLPLPQHLQSRLRT